MRIMKNITKHHNLLDDLVEHKIKQLYDAKTNEDMNSDKDGLRRDRKV